MSEKIAELKDLRKDSYDLLLKVVSRGYLNERSAQAISNKLDRAGRKTVEAIKFGLENSLKEKRQTSLARSKKDYSNSKMVIINLSFWREMDDYERVRNRAKQTKMFVKPFEKKTKKETTTVMKEVKHELLFKGVAEVPLRVLTGVNSGTAFYAPTLQGFPDGDDLLKKLEPFMNPAIVHIFRSSGGIIVVDSMASLPIARLHNPLTKPMTDSTNQSKIMNKYIEYKRPENPEDFKQLLGEVDMNDYIKENFKDEACAFTAIINAYSASFEKLKLSGRYPKVEMTYQWLWNFFFPDEPYNEEQAMGLSIEQMTRFFEHFHLKFICMDVYYNVIHSYTPVVLNRYISPKCLYILYHNKHCYQLNSKIKSLEQIVDDEKEKEFIVTNKYSFSSKQKFLTFIKEIDQLNLIDFKELEEKKETYIEVCYNNDLYELLNHLVYELKYIPQIGWEGFKLGRIMFKIGDICVNITNAGVSDIDVDQDFKDNTYFEIYSNYEHNIKTQLINKNTLSKYHPSLLHAFKQYRRTPMKTAFMDKNPIKADCYDIVKAFTSNLLDMDKIPVFNYYDGFKNYDNTPVQDYSLYLVEKTGHGDHIYLDSRFNLVSGLTLNKLKVDVKIIAYCRPSKLVMNSSKLLINQLYSSDLEVEHKKFLMNKVIGLCGKLSNRRFEAKLFTDYDEACHYRKEFGGTVLPINQFTEAMKGIEKDCANADGEIDIDLMEKKSSELVDKFIQNYGNIEEANEENDLDAGCEKMEGEGIKFVDFKKMQTIYIHIQKAEKELVEGFYPIQFFIYDIMRMKMQQLYNDLQAKGAHVYAIHTDSLFVDKKVIDIKKFNKDKFEGIGKIRFDENKDCPSKVFVFRENKLVLNLMESPKVNLIEIKDEYNKKEFEKVFKENESVLIKAEVAGAGKTTSIKNYAKKIGISKTLFVTPYNTLAYDLCKDKYLAVTLHQLLGLRITDNGDEEANSTKKKGKIDVVKCNNNVFEREEIELDTIKVIVFDEIYCYQTKSLYQINRFMMKNKGVTFLATGDENQNRPIEPLNVLDYKLYYNEIIARMFPNQINLKVSKRLASEEDKEKLFTIKNLILHSDTPLLEISRKYFKPIKSLSQGKGFHITYTNPTAKEVNKYWHEKNKVKKGYVTIDDIKYYPNMDVVCRNYIRLGKQKIHINFVYEITDINREKVTLIDKLTNEEFVLKTQMLKNFSLNYARTCHSVQGVTIANEITIYDVNFWYVTREWFYTAITRCTSLDNIYVMDADTIYHSPEMAKAKILKKIESYKEQDKKKDRVFDKKHYVDFKWICETLKAQDMKCNKFECQATLMLDYKSGDPYQFSVNRLDNNLAHTKDNCEITCLHCNVKYH